MALRMSEAVANPRPSSQVVCGGRSGQTEGTHYRSGQGHHEHTPLSKPTHGHKATPAPNSSKPADGTFKGVSGTCGAYRKASLAPGGALEEVYEVRREADKLSVGLLPCVEVHGGLNHSVSVNNAKRQNRGEQHRLKDRLGRLHRDLSYQARKITESQKSIVDELLREYPHLEKQLSIVFSHNPQLLIKLGLPRYRVHTKVLHVCRPDLQLDPDTPTPEPPSQKSEISHKSRPPSDLVSEYTSKRCNTSVDRTEYSTQKMKGTVGQTRAIKSSGYPGPQSLQLSGVKYFEPLSAQDELDVKDNKMENSPQRGLTSLASLDKAYNHTSTELDRGVAGTKKSKGIVLSDLHARGDSDSSGHHQYRYVSRTPTVLPEIKKQGSHSSLPQDDGQRHLDEPMGPYTLTLKVSHYVDTDFGFHRDKVKPSAGMSQKKPHLSHPRDLERDIASTAQKHIYACQIPSLRTRGSRAEERVASLRQTLQPRGAHSLGVLPQPDGDPRLRYRRLEIELGAGGGQGSGTRVYRGGWSPRRETTKVPPIQVQPDIVTMSPVHRK